MMAAICDVCKPWQYSAKARRAAAESTSSSSEATTGSAVPASCSCAGVWWRASSPTSMLPTLLVATVLEPGLDLPIHGLQPLALPCQPELAGVRRRLVHARLMRGQPENQPQRAARQRQAHAPTPQLARRCWQARRRRASTFLCIPHTHTRRPPVSCRLRRPPPVDRGSLSVSAAELHYRTCILNQQERAGGTAEAVLDVTQGGGGYRGIGKGEPHPRPLRSAQELLCTWRCFSLPLARLSPRRRGVPRARRSGVPCRHA